MSVKSSWGILWRGMLPLLVGLGIFWPLAAHSQDFTGKTISAVQIRYRGAKTVDEARLRNFMSVKAGDKFSPDLLDMDIKSLYESGLVDDVRFLAEPDGERLKLIAEVVTRPIVPGVGFVGNTVFSEKKLAKETKLRAGGPLSDAAILTARRNIEELYLGYGYPDVLVEHRLQETGREGMADLIFVIDEGVKNEVRKIRFVGNTAFSNVELRREMETKEKGLFSWISKSGRIKPGALQNDIDKLQDFYRNNGYLRVNIDGVQREPVKNGRVDLVIPIYEGVKYSVQSVAFGKMTVFTAEELQPAMSLTAGDPYSAKRMADDIRMIRSYYGSRGYADATVSPEIRNVGPDAVSIAYRISEGRRYKVGRVNIEGNLVTQDKVVRREVPMKPGDWFNSVDVDTTKRRLENLNYFNQVQVTGSTSAQTGYRDVNILLNEKKTGSISFGAGFSSIDNIVGYLNLEQTNFDIRRPWAFTGGGQRFGMQLRLGAERQDFKISLVEPWFMGRRLSLGTELYVRSLQFLSDEYEQSSFGGAVFLRKPLGRKGYVKGEYRLEKIVVDVSAPLGSDFWMDDGDFIRSALAFNYVYDSRDSNIIPRRGGRANVGLTLAGLGGDVEIYTASASGSKHWNLPWDLIFNLSGSFAVSDAYDGGYVPVFDRQFLGGSRNLRGFEYRDVGPRDNGTGVDEVGATYDVLGGKTAGYGTVEMTFPIVENVRGAAFLDAGFVSEDAWDPAIGDLYSDGGLGLRLNLPFGPLALDYAIPISAHDPLADKGGQFNFYMNYQF